MQRDETITELGQWGLPLDEVNQLGERLRHF
jgi:hypothetical protein